jgi:hypothetical protein
MGCDRLCRENSERLCDTYSIRIVADSASNVLEETADIAYEQWADCRRGGSGCLFNPSWVIARGGEGRKILGLRFVCPSEIEPALSGCANLIKDPTTPHDGIATWLPPHSLI